MNVEMARQGRLRALTLVNSDKILVRNAQSGDDVVIPPKLSVDAHLLSELLQGVEIEHIMRETGWSSSKVMEQLYKVAKRAKLGIERRDGRLHLLYPTALEEQLHQKLARSSEDRSWLNNQSASVHALRSVDVPQ